MHQTSPMEPEESGLEIVTDPRPDYRRRRLVAGIVVLVALALLVGLGVVVVRALTPKPAPPPPPLEGCVARTELGSVLLSREQMGIADIVVGVAIREGMGVRGATIGLATAWQESSLRNLPDGDRDSIGVFQQRPSQGWGTPEQLRDPYYASLAFYDALVKLPDWETGDINDLAQQVQRSGVPDGYRKHVENATLLATVLAGDQPRALTCIDRSTTPGDPSALLAFARDTYGATGVIADGKLTFTMQTSPGAWRMAYLAIAHGSQTGVASVTIGDQRHVIGRETKTDWETVDSVGATTVVVTFR